MTAHPGEVRRRILDAALRAAPFDGWTPRVLREAARAAGYDAAMADRAFPDGVDDILALFVAEADAAMVRGLAQRELADLPLRERIALALRLRLEWATPHREAVRRALTAQVLPGHQGAALRSLYRTVDAVWRAVGDRSSDFSFYTRRVQLAGVYMATLLFWLDDRSEDLAETWAFLERRLDGVMRLHRTRKRLTDRMAGLPSPWAALGRLRHRRGRRRHAEVSDAAA